MIRRIPRIHNSGKKTSKNNYTTSLCPKSCPKTKKTFLQSLKETCSLIYHETETNCQRPNLKGIQSIRIMLILNPIIENDLI